MATSTLFRVLLAPVVLLATGACFATKNDALILQRDIRSTRDAALQSVARSDSMHRAQMDSVYKLLRSFQDSLRIYQNSQLDRTGNLTGDQRMLSRDVQSLNARMDLFEDMIRGVVSQLALMREEANQRAVANIPAAADSTKSGQQVDPASAAAPGPLALLTLANENMARQVFPEARNILTMLLDQYPDDSVAAEATYIVAETYRLEKRTAEADSTYQVVATRFPGNKTWAPRALWLYSQSLVTQQREAEAIPVWRRIVADYPDTEYALLAKDRIPPLRQ